MPRIWTVGYERWSADAFVELLFAAGVEVLADVRDLPLSRKSGFSKTPLAKAVATLGIEYVHLRELGAPEPIRHALRAGSPFTHYRRGYEAHLPYASDAFERLQQLARSRPTAMMCYEREPTHCHRGILAEHLQRIGFEVKPLGSRAAVAEGAPEGAA
ncbi:MAG TPA: DUF488 domain-containing protein [Candidatus Thermoplasmatota archaeon]|nr:DUF488 domain-containing protein [Candidatus Thermoplasmatota archaeon]